MGGRVRVMLAGGAPLSPDTHEQIKLCLCTDVVQGYGLTETTSGATVMDGKQHSVSLCGFIDWHCRNIHYICSSLSLFREIQK